LAVVETIETVPDRNGRARVARISFNENLGDAKLAWFGEWMERFPYLDTVLLTLRIFARRANSQAILSCGFK
jgi:hypothetical protein